MISAMEDIEGVTPFPSEANFILFRVKDAHTIYGRLLEKGILVRNMSDAVSGCLRVTIGMPKENALFLRALEKIA